MKILFLKSTGYFKDKTILICDFRSYGTDIIIYYNTQVNETHLTAFVN